MTNQLEALELLIEAVEAGEASGKFAKLCADAGIAGHSIDAASANVGSLDAAKSLHEALLPGWWYVIDHRTCSVADMGDGPFYNHDTRGNPARAWLLAILRAHRAQIGGQ